MACCSTLLALAVMLRVATRSWDFINPDPIISENRLLFPHNSCGVVMGRGGEFIRQLITATGAYSCLRVELLFVRQLSFFVVTVYVPCTMTVSVSWMSFWLDHKAVPARAALTPW